MCCSQLAGNISVLRGKRIPLVLTHSRFLRKADNWSHHCSECEHDNNWQQEVRVKARFFFKLHNLKLRHSPLPTIAICSDYRSYVLVITATLKRIWVGKYRNNAEPNFLKKFILETTLTFFNWRTFPSDMISDICKIFNTTSLWRLFW